MLKQESVQRMRTAIQGLAPVERRALMEVVIRSTSAAVGKVDDDGMVEENREWGSVLTASVRHSSISGVAGRSHR